MDNPLARIWQMIFKGQNARAAAVSREIGHLQQMEFSREEKLKTAALTLTRRAYELDRLVEEMKENRRGQNG